ncbi:unnamed protein product, partial [Caretta caretta]
MTMVKVLLQYLSTSSLLCLAGGLVAFIYFLTSSEKSICSLSPGPPPLPLIGNLNVVDLKKPFQSLMELSEKQNTDMPSVTELWKTMRRFTLSTLRDFGVGKKTIEVRILEELNFIINYFESHQGKPFDVKVILNSAVSNVICSILFGERFQYEDPIFLTLLKLLNENSKLLGSPMMQQFGLYNYIISLGFLFGAPKTVLRNVDELNAFLEKFFKEHRQEFNENNLTGFVDAFLMKQQQESRNSHTHFHNENLLFSTLDLFAACTETISTTVRWGLLMMMKYPEIQRRIQEEIDQVIEPGQMPMLEDRKKLPYTDAVIHEIQRFSNIVPMSVSCSTSTNVSFRGYMIPNGIEVIPLLTSVLKDKLHWETPDQFNPSHFLDADGSFTRKEAFIPFSIGRRVCAGEGLAKMELFLFFAGLLRKFIFQPHPGVAKADLDLTADVGFTLNPMPHLICAVPRE